MHPNNFIFQPLYQLSDHAASGEPLWPHSFPEGLKSVHEEPRRELILLTVHFQDGAEPPGLGVLAPRLQQHPVHATDILQSLPIPSPARRRSRNPRFPYGREYNYAAVPAPGIPLRQKKSILGQRLRLGGFGRNDNRDADVVSVHEPNEFLSGIAAYIACFGKQNISNQAYDLVSVPEIGKVRCDFRLTINPKS